MTLPDGYTDLPPGTLANVVTCLEMTEATTPAGDDKQLFRLEPLRGNDAQRYRDLLLRVGGRYLWAARFDCKIEELRALLDDADVAAYALRNGDEDSGILELDFRSNDECELRYFGVVEKLIGSGAGRWLMNRAVELAWSRPIRRFWVHTCTLDHPAALPFYIRSGFRPFKRQIEILDDPRVVGLLPPDVAPDIPLL